MTRSEEITARVLAGERMARLAVEFNITGPRVRQLVARTLSQWNRALYLECCPNHWYQQDEPPKAERADEPLARNFSVKWARACAQEFLAARGPLVEDW